MSCFIVSPACTIGIGAALVANHIGSTDCLNNRRSLVMAGGAPFFLAGLQSKGIASSMIIDAVLPVVLGTNGCIT